MAKNWHDIQKEADAPPWVFEGSLPPVGPSPPTTVEEMVRRLQDIRQAGQPIGKTSRVKPPEEDFTSAALTLVGILIHNLGKFYGLGPDGCSIVFKLLATPTDKELLAVFADWLEEQGKQEAERVRTLSGGGDK